MKEKILVVLVVVALVLSTLSLVLTLRTNTINVDSETTRADSLELKILNSIDYGEIRKHYARTDNETLVYQPLHMNSSIFETMPKTQVDVPTFLDDCSQMAQVYAYAFIIRYQNTFYTFVEGKGLVYCIP